jgi:hypothetical protein
VVAPQVGEQLVEELPGQEVLLVGAPLEGGSAVQLLQRDRIELADPLLETVVGRVQRVPSPTQLFLRSTARLSWSLFIFDRPSTPSCLASL